MDLDLGGLAAALSSATVTIHTELVAGVSIIAEKIEKTAKEEFGVYQSAIGDFNAWADLKDSTISDRVRKGYSPNDPLLRTGELRDSIQHETSGLEAVIGSKDPLMLWQECGTEKGIPPRPVIGPAFARNEEEIAKVIEAALITGLKL